MQASIKSPLTSPLSGFSLLSINGNDRHAFLHGQFINDLNLISEPGAQLSAWCNPKGQVISNFLIINTGTSYSLMFKDDLKAYVQKRLALFVLRSEVQIEDISEQTPLYGLANTKDLSAFGLNAAMRPGEIQAINGLIIVCLPDSLNRYLIMGNRDILTTKLSELTPAFAMAESSVWQLLDILAGLPWITSATQEQFLPQMLNLDALKGLSYQKGCYPGQEVIARLHYKGTVKKRLSLIKSEQPFSVGDNILAEKENKNVGSIINSATHPEEGAYSLAIIELDKIEEKLVCNNQSINMTKLPYAIES